MTSNFVPSGSSLWESATPNLLPNSNAQEITSDYGDITTASYNHIWDHHHHHHHHSNAPLPYRPEFFPGFTCSSEFWPSPLTTSIPNSGSSSAETYRSTSMGHHTRSNPKSSSSVGSSQKKTRRRVATIAQRRAANIRERRRMFNLNEAFDKLRRKVPTFAYEKRLSRIETLRLAITYISFMNEILDGNTKTDVPSSIYQMQSQREYVPYSLIPT